MNGEGNDELINDEQIAKEMEFEKLCASGDCSSMPAKQKMQIKVGVIFQKNKKVFRLPSNPGASNSFIIVREEEEERYRLAS